MPVKKLLAMLGSFAIISMMLAGCPARQPQPVERVGTSTVSGQAKGAENQPGGTPDGTGVTKEVEPGQADYTRPHPILGDLRIRRAIAYCTNRDQLIASVYPFISDEQRAELRMDSFLPRTHWAYKGPYTDYPYNKEEGIKLLEAAGWKLKEGDSYRTNAEGAVLALKFTTTEAQFRQAYAAVMEQNLKDCGIQLVRQNTPASWLFGDTTGLARRDFELAAYSWLGQSDPASRPQYACNEIPLAQQQLGRPELHGLVQRDCLQGRHRRQQHLESRRTYQETTTSSRRNSLRTWSRCRCSSAWRPRRGTPGWRASGFHRPSMQPRAPGTGR